MRKILGILPRLLKWQSRYTAMRSANNAQNSCNALLGISIINPRVNSKNNAQYFDI